MVQDQFGYPFEKHTYHTADGYINSVYRIAGPKGTLPQLGKKTGKKVVIYQHGLIDCCAGIICAGEESLGLRLVNQGYELWINNSRGNRYSRDHQLIDIDHDTYEKIGEYFEFSFSEMARYDQPALWEYIESVTGESKLVYIGHSQGTT